MTLKYFNLMMEGWGLLFCLLGGVILFAAVRIDRSTKRYFRGIFLFLALDLLANMGGLLFRGQTDPVGNTALHISNFLEYFWGDVLTLVLAMYLLHLIDRKKKTAAPIWRYIVWGTFMLAVALLILSQFTGIFYTIDADGIYHRGSLFWLSQVLAIFSLVLNLVIIANYREQLSRAQRICFYVYTWVPIAALLLQLIFYGIYFLLLASTIAAVFMLCVILLDQTEQYYQVQQELADMRSSMVLSQIQPHFLYNSLTAIAYLCEKAPTEAKQATLAFADYLRTNMNALNSQKTVPFSQELEHVKTYLYLEQLRFGEDLHVVMQIEAEDFRLPPLTIQPLIENAVKWGIGKKEDGGTVTLCTRETKAGTEVMILDDGVGFRPDEQPDSKRRHLGIQSVRSRLQRMCGAELEIKSQVGQGTTVRFVIPKEDI